MLYAAYGSNMNLNQMKYRCPNSGVVGNGIVSGYELVFNVHADIIKSDDSYVPVVVWNIDDDDWDSLDAYEGYPDYYIKDTVSVTMDNGDVYKAVAYMMGDNAKGVYPPNQSYFDCIIEGYEQNNIDDKKCLYEALDYSIDYIN